MRLKLDENLPGRATNGFEAFRHDVDTAADEGLAGHDDAALLEAATRDGRLLVTMDRGLGDVRSYPPGTHAGVLVVRIEDQSPRAIAAAVDLICATVDLEDLAGCIAVFRRGDLRVRRANLPEEESEEPEA